MAIISSFTRTERFFEVDDCPLRKIGTRSQVACKTCRFNVASPGREQVGCVANTAFAAYQRALERLAARSAADHRRLLDILERERTERPGEALAEGDLQELLRIGVAWCAVPPADADEAAVARTLHDFAHAAAELREPVRILA
jgi:hypothetical protein